MSYIEDISRMQNVTVRDVIEVSKKYVPREYKYCPWKYPEINHGIALLQSEDALVCYMAAYGEMHEIKCKSAFRGIPYDTLGNFEIIDWGCGQGVGSLCLIEMMRDREKVHLIQKVTLIEPSEVAIQRALFNVNIFTNGGSQVETICQFLPGFDSSNQDNFINGIQYSYRTVVHIFSNILDIPNIDLAKLAFLFRKAGVRQIFVCVGPKNNNYGRLQSFAEIFNPEKIFINIDSASFGYTSSYGYHNFGCKAFCFEYNNEPFSEEALNKIPNAIEEAPIFDDYNYQLAVTNGVLNIWAAKIIEKLSSCITDDDIIYYSPSINGDTCDLVILKPNNGIFVFKVFDKDINQLSEVEVKQNLPHLILRRIKENIITLHIKTTAENRLEQTGYWSIVHTISLFSQNTTKQVGTFYEENKINHDYVTIWGNDVIDNDIKSLVMDIGFMSWNRWMSSTIYKDFINIISPQWHSYREGKQISLSPIQKDLSISLANTKRKIKGFAGAGKTEVLVHRAVNAQIRTGEKVLILTYNLTLRNYIHSRLSDVRADFAWDKFYITNYHQFIKSAVNNLNITFEYAFYEDASLYVDLCERTERYSAIFIDEIQDFSPSWLTIINDFFLKEGGELVVFGDPKQAMYDNCEFDSAGDVRIGVIPGVWNSQLVRSLRFSNDQLSRLAVNFNNIFLERKQQLASQQQIEYEASHISYKLINNPSYRDLIIAINDILGDNEIEIQDVVILAANHETIRNLEFEYQTIEPNAITHTTSESKAQYDLLYSRFKGEVDNEMFIKEMKAIRRAKKMFFSKDKRCLKLSTIHSYKGLDAANVVLIIESSDLITPKTIYTGITRARNNLFIISMGNLKYDSFFESLI